MGIQDRDYYREWWNEREGGGKRRVSVPQSRRRWHKVWATLKVWLTGYLVLTLSIKALAWLTRLVM